METTQNDAHETEIRIFISSPSDVEGERIRASAALTELAAEFDDRFKITAIRWEESYYSAHKTFQSAIPAPSSCDLVVCILWKRLGSELPPDFDRSDGTSRTGTEYEFEEALEAALQHETPDILVYKKKTKVLFDADRVEQEHAELRALNAFWQKWFRDEQGHFTAGFDSFDTVDEFADKLKRHLRQWILRRGEVVTWPIAVKGSPYRGLEAFDAEHADVFFGRRRAVRQVVARLQTCAVRGCAFLVVLGMSGAGKSSLVRAGVLPWLMLRRAVPEVDEWRACVVRPGSLSDDPVLGLVTALFAPGALPELAQGDHSSAALLASLAKTMPPTTAVAVAAALNRAGDAARRRDKLDRPVEARLILVIDQLEELLSLPAEARDLLLAVIDALARGGKVWVIATLRSDLYPEIQAAPRMLKLKEDGGSFDLLPPGAAEVREIIEGPARAAGLVLEHHDDRSLADLLEAAALEPGSLPLLEFTLESLFEQRDAASKTLLLSVYDALGGLEGAIAREAERLVAGLPEALQAALPGLLIALVDMDETRETATARTLARTTLADRRQIELADLMVKHRFLVADGAGAGATLRLAHEALLVHWPRLAELIREHADFLNIRRRLQREAATWMQRGRHADFLLPSGRRLAEAEDALNTRRGDLDATVIAYIEASSEAARLRAEVEREREAAVLRRDLEAARRLMRRTRAAAIVTLALLAVVGGFATLWLSQRQAARDRAIEAERNYGIALDGATKNIALVEREHDVGDVSTSVAQALLNASRDTFKGLSTAAGGGAGAALAQLRLFDALATSNLAIGNLDAALDAAQTESGLAARLAAAAPANAEWQHGLAVSHERVGDVLREQRNFAAALGEYRAELAIASQLAAKDPANAEWRQDLSDAHAKVGDILFAQGDTGGAVKEFQAQLAIATELAASDPNAQRDLALSHERLGDAFRRQNDLAAALTEHQAERGIMTALAAKLPDNANAQRDLAIAHENVGDDFLAQGNADAALAEYRAALPIVTQIAARDPSNTGWQRDVSVVHEKLGNAYRAQKNLAAALSEYRADFAIAAQLAAKEPENPRWQEDLSISHQDLGDVLHAQGDTAGALAEYRAKLAILAPLAQHRATSTVWQERLALAYEQVGELLQSQGNLPNALQAYRAELAITAPLAAADRGDAGRQRDLAISHAKIGDVLRGTHDTSGALAEFRNCLAATAGADPSALADIQHYCQQRVAQLQP